MRRDTINYVVVGIFVLVLFALFMMILYQITGRTGPTDSYFVTYENVEGIKYGTPVLFEGYPIGQVEKVEPVKESGGTTFRLTLAVTKGWQIPADSFAKVVKSGLLSAVAIDIEEGTSNQPLSPDDPIAGEEATDLFATVNAVAADIKSLSRDSLRPLLDNLNRQVDLISTDWRSLTAEDVRPILAKLNDSASQLKRILNEENQENIRSTLDNLESASGRVDELLANLRETRASLDALLTDTDRLVSSNEEDIRSVVKDLKKSLYTVSQHIDAVADHLEGSARNMHEFTREVRENPGLLIRGSPQPDSGAGQ
ncbi:MAG: MlaD family protein [Gammaproteobacteria bacterium]